MAAVLDTGDTAWILVSTALVMLMTVPGLALFYGGLVKKETVLNTLFLSFSAYAIVSIIWFIYGYPMVFGADIHGLIGAPGNFFFCNVVESNTLVGTIPTSVYAAYQMTFAAITVALISGALIGRLKFGAWMLFVPLWSTFVYLPVAHWVWGGGWLAQLGALDFAGGTVVHINSAVAALALILLLKGRKDQRLLPHQLGYAIIGAGLLWFGWFGFNAGSALVAGQL
ncbi:MAG: ammonia channel protein, partial [Euryarchaeota archaeon]